MTHDLIERLRKGTGKGLQAYDWMQEAADEIENLQRLLKRTTARLDILCGKSDIATLVAAELTDPMPKPEEYYPRECE